jgi:hypothetical protein
MSSTTVLSRSCLEVEDHQFYQFYPVNSGRTHDPLHSRQEHDKTVVELMILYTQDKNRIKQW